MSWAMIPLALWAAAPYHGCLCNNGNVKLFCVQLFGGECPQCSGAKSSADGRPASSCCRRTGERASDHHGPSNSCRVIAGDVMVPAEAAADVAYSGMAILTALPIDATARPMQVAVLVGGSVATTTLDRVIAHCRLVI